MKFMIGLLIAAFLVIPAAASPAINSWGNNKTDNNNLILTINTSEAVKFNTTANQTINLWNWYKDEVNQGINYDNFTTSFTAGTHTVRVNATNDNGTSNTITWNVTAQKRAVNLKNISALAQTTNAGTYVTYILNLTNNGSDTDSYILAVDNPDIASYASLNISSPVFLNAGQSIIFSLNVTNTSSGIFHVNVTARSNNDTSQFDYVNTTTNVTAQVVGASNKPYITSWGNNKTNNTNLTLKINTNETVRFNVTANQTISSWLWTLNGNGLTNPSDTLTYMFNNAGFYKVAVKGSNTNGTTQTIVWNVTVQGKEGRKSTSLLSWSPQVVDYVYVNDTVNETIEYSIITAEPMDVNNWSVDGTPVAGIIDGDTYTHTHTWDNKSVGLHAVIYRGSNADSRVEFRWYVNVYKGEYPVGSIFEVIDDALENHVTDIKIRMFKYKMEKHDENADFAVQKVNRLHDEIAKRQMTREALREEFKAGNITIEEYVAAMKQVQREAKYNAKLAKELAKIAKEDMKDEKSSAEFEKLSDMDGKKEHVIKNNGKEIGTNGNGKTKKNEEKEIGTNGNGKTKKNEEKEIGTNGNGKTKKNWTETEDGNKGKGYDDD